jgi:Na+-transporting NADH:ubiquinone oxidoreductase subunit B
VFQKQVIMRRVLYSLLPIFLFSIYLYGWRVLAIAAVVFSVGILTEFIVERGKKKKVSEAVLVTCSLFTLSMPPGAPLWIPAIGILFGVLLGKEVYGGFGRNVYNPAITGRLFVYITFPVILARSWMSPGNFGIGARIGEMVDGASTATPLFVLRNGGSTEFINEIIGLQPGSMGESSILLILLAAAYLLITKTANWRLLLSTLASAALLSAVFFFSGLTPELPPHLALANGSILFVSVFMATDPVTAPNKKAAQWLYGLIIGFVAIIVRTFSAFAEGTSFGIMVGNTFASLLDELAGKIKKKAPAAKAQPAAASAEGGGGGK